MKSTLHRAAALALVVALAAAPGCREDAGDPDLSLLEGWENPEALPGPDPYVAGEARLSLGLFYEGDSSELMPIDGTTANYFIFEAYAGGPLTYTQLEDDRYVVEGFVSDRLTHAGLTFWGGGVFWTAPRDMSGWTVLHVSLRSDDASFADVNVGLQANNVDFLMPAADYGYVNDGEWHHLLLPLADFAEDGADLTAITGPIILSGGQGTVGDTLHVDALYWTAE